MCKFWPNKNTYVWAKIKFITFTIQFFIKPFAISTISAQKCSQLLPSLKKQPELACHQLYFSRKWTTSSKQKITCFEKLLRYRLFIIKISWLKIWINDDNAFNSAGQESFCQSCDSYHVWWSLLGEKSRFQTNISVLGCIKKGTCWQIIEK